MGRLLQLLLMFGPAIYRAYQSQQRQQSRMQRQQPRQRGGYERQQPRDGRYVDHRRAPQRRTPPPPPDNSKFKKSGVEKYKEYDYKGAIEDFQKALEINPMDANAHFNIACAYSLVEDATKSFVHLDQAVAHGFKDLNAIKTHDGLAYLRVHKRFDKFEKNGYRLIKEKTKK